MGILPDLIVRHYDRAYEGKGDFGKGLLSAAFFIHSFPDSVYRMIQDYREVGENSLEHIGDENFDGGFTIGMASVLGTYLIMHFTDVKDYYMFPIITNSLSAIYVAGKGIFDWRKGKLFENSNLHKFPRIKEEKDDLKRGIVIPFPADRVRKKEYLEGNSEKNLENVIQKDIDVGVDVDVDVDLE